MSDKIVEIKIKMPMKWIDPESPSLISWAVREKFERLIQEAIDEQYIPKLKLPNIKITEAEVKDRMLDILARKALKNHDNGSDTN